MFNVTGTVVVEFQIPLPWTYAIYYHLAHTLGMRYHGVLSTRCEGDKCADGMEVHMEYINTVLDYVFEHVLRLQNDTWEETGMIHYLVIWHTAV